MIKNPIEYLFDLLETPACIICSKTGKCLCAGCFHSQILEKDTRCYICNKLTNTPGVCRLCPSRLRRVQWLGRYQGVLKDLIWQMKFERQRAHARLFGDYLDEALPYVAEGTLVTAMPTASDRIRRRSFDQAALIARVFARYRKLSYQSLLERTSQVDLIGKSRSERIRLMRSSLRLSASALLQGKTVLIIDDVLTTGASLEAAAQLLRTNGAKHVDAAVVAH